MRNAEDGGGTENGRNNTKHSKDVVSRCSLRLMNWLPSVPHTYNTDSIPAQKELGPKALQFGRELEQIIFMKFTNLMYFTESRMGMQIA